MSGMQQGRSFGDDEDEDEDVDDEEGGEEEAEKEEEEEEEEAEASQKESDDDWAEEDPAYDSVHVKPDTTAGSSPQSRARSSRTAPPERRGPMPMPPHTHAEAPDPATPPSRARAHASAGASPRGTKLGELKLKVPGLGVKGKVEVKLELHANDDLKTLTHRAGLIASKYGLSQKDVTKIVDAALRKIVKAKARVA